MTDPAHLSLLIVDNSPEDRFAIRMFLSASTLAGCSIHEADGGLSGLAAMQRLRPDCVLLDYRLPDMDGLAVLDRARAANTDPQFAVVVLTGGGDEATAAAALQAGAQDYLPKDYLNEKSLPLTIRNAINRFALVRSRREHEEKLQLFIDRAPAAVAMFDRDMRFLQVSRRYVRDAVPDASKPDNLIGRIIYDAIPDLPDDWRAAHRRALAGETLAVEEDRFVRADGRVEWWRWEMTPWFEAEGDVAGILLFAERIDARKHVEDALRMSEERLRISQETGKIGCFEQDITTGSLYWSEQQYKIFGLSILPACPITFDKWLRLIHPDDRARIAEQARHAVNSPDINATTLVYRITPPTQGRAGLRWIHVDAEIKRDPRGKPLRMIGVSMDITERRETEMTLRRLTEDLEQRVAEEVAAREAAQLRLVQTQRMEALGQLAGGIAHDFNNILQAVSGSLGLIERRVKDVDAVRRFAAMASDAAERGRAITGRLLAFSRSGTLRSEPIFPLPLLEGQRDMLLHTLGHFITITVDASPALPSLLADKGQLETALVNLAVNARDAMPEGGTLTLRARSTSVPDGTTHPADLAPGEYIAISVSDTGCGMDPATAARAIEPFFTTKPVGKGTGLGLAMAHGFAQQSGGGFRIASTLNAGTTVTLWFPAVRRTVPETHDDLKSAPASVGPRILAVDDDPIVNDIVVGLLGDEGYHIVPASSGSAALKCLDAGEVFDVLIADFAMPGMTGLVLMKQARLRQPDLPVLLLTGCIDAEVQANIDRHLSDITGVLRKPFTAVSLQHRVADLLRHQIHPGDGWPDQTPPNAAKAVNTSRDEPVMSTNAGIIDPLPDHRHF